MSLKERRRYISIRAKPQDAHTPPNLLRDRCRLVWEAREGMARTTSTPATEERPVSGSAGEAAERDKERGAYKRERVVAGQTVQRADDRKKN